MKLDKEDKKILIWGFIIGTILNLFIDKGIDVVIMIGVLYFLHKYVDINKFTENIEFIDREKYIQGLNKAIRVLDIYIVVKIIMLLVIKMGGFNGLELILVGQLILMYNEKLSRKYIKSIDGIEIEKKRKLVNNKVLTSIIAIVFIGFTYIYFSNIEIKNDYIISPKYKYQLTNNEDNKRTVDFSGNGFSQVATENEDNKNAFDRYIEDIKLLLSMDILEDYLKVATIFMFILAFSQFNFKDKTKKANSVLVNGFLVAALLFSTIESSTYSIDLEYKIISDFAEQGLY